MPAKKKAAQPRYGFIDARGEWVIAPRFDSAKLFACGLAPASENGQWGYVDKTGAFVLAPQWTAAEPFNAHGVARVNGLTDIGTDGKPLPVPRATGEPKTFSEGLSPAELGGLTGYIDEARRWVLEPRWTRGFHFSEGIAWVWEPDAKGASAIDRGGKTLFRVDGFFQCFAFAGGLARVIGMNPRRVGWFDRAGKLVDLGARDGAPPTTGDHPGRDFSEGVAAVWTGAGWACIDERGATLFETSFAEIGPFSHGRARVRDGNRWGYIDRTGALVVPATLRQAGPFDGERAAAQNDDGWVLLDATGKPYSQSYGQIMGFDDRGHAIVTIGGLAGTPTARYGLIDRAGAVLIEPKLEELKAFAGDRAAARWGGKWGVVDRTGKPLADARYELIGTLAELTVVNVGGTVGKNGFAGGKWGFIDASGAEAIPPRFDVAGRFSDGLAVAATV